MAKASIVAAKQAQAVASIDDRLEKVEKQNAQILKILKSGTAEVAALDGEVIEGETLFVGEQTGWMLSDGELSGVFATIEQICTKAGLTWEAANLESTDFDPVDYIQTHLTRIADRFAPPVDAAPAPPILPQKPVDPQPNAQPPKVEAGKVGTDTGEKPKTK